MHRTRERKTDQGITDFAVLVQAIKQVKIARRSERSVAMEFNISLTTLRRHMEKLCDEIPDLSAVSDEHLVDVLHGFRGRGAPTVGITNFWLCFK